MAEKTVEERLAALEAAVAELQRRMGAPRSIKDWLESIGTVTDLEAFDEACRLGREWRESQRLPEDEETAP
ncbi:MAG TPA: hypothetical protein VMS17_22550 [Gemmataceae bacterium]|nr:hypothetical protein [Gemmataceae bacterium]